MAFKNYKEASKSSNWGRETEGGLTLKEINTGAILRIADATEVIAKSYNDLLADRNYYKRRCEEKNIEIDRLVKQRSSLRGVITRLKNKAKLV